MVIHTIGYEGLKLDAYLTLLADKGIDTIVEMREIQLSRKTSFSKTALTNVLNFSDLDGNSSDYATLIEATCFSSRR